ncbi:MAG: MOSC domain-containing protein [Chloroflexota bacterium]|nr:MAG: MOSC domain-containing protein [Chloroflexota bacterium]
MAGRVAFVNVSPGGVPKLPVASAWVGRLGLDADAHDEPEPVHGGPDQAVCLYSIEAIARVAADGHQAFPGAYGENLTIEGIDWAALRAGDRLAIGDDGLEIELTDMAGPCQTIAHWFVERRIARISPKLQPEDARWYARVAVEGQVKPGDRVDVLRPVEEARSARSG